MKTTMTIIKCTLMTIAIACTSCSKDGDIGPIGPQGEQGIQGEQGPAGEDGEALGIPGPQGETGATGATGATGPAGEDGTNGANGEDGNANVSTFTYDLSTESGATIAITATALTQDVVENDLILGYLLKNEDTYTPIPSSIYAFGLNDNSDIAVEIQLNRYWMFFYEVGTENFKSVTAGQLDELKLVIIESNSTTSGKSSKEDILSKMKSDGVNTDDYYAVMDYFGLNF